MTPLQTTIEQLYPHKLVVRKRAGAITLWLNKQGIENYDMSFSAPGEYVLRFANAYDFTITVLTFGLSPD